MNKVISKFTAVINGSPTALSGCNNTSCLLECLRKDPKLDSPVNHNLKNTPCNYRIPIYPE